MSFSRRATAAFLLIAAGCTTIQTVPEERRTVSLRYINNSFARFDRETTSVSFMRTPSLETSYRRSAAAVATLRTIAGQSRMTRIPLRYARSLDYDLRTVEGVAVQMEPTPAQVEALSYAVIGLETKADYAVANKDSWAELVDVTVHTVRARDGQPVHGLEVWYCPRGWASSIPHWQRFSSLSTPTTERLAPGVYLVATGGPDSGAKPMRVGLNGQRKVEFTLQVP